MSCRRKTLVLRMPAKAVGIRFSRGRERFEAAYHDRLRRDPGCFAPAPCSHERGCFIDCVWYDGGDAGLVY